MLKKIKHEADFFGQKVVLQMGEIAMQSDAAVLATVGETSVLATVVSKEPSEPLDFFPLKIDYEERYYAGGVIGGTRYSRREGKPNDDAVISGRLIDHALRPLFPKDFVNDTQLVLTVFSIDKVNDPALVAFLAATAAFSVSGMPFKGPAAAIRISRANGVVKSGFHHESAGEDLDMIVSYLDDGSKVQAIEAHGHIVPEKEVVAAIKEGSKVIPAIFKIAKDFAAEANVPVKAYKPSWINKDSVSEFKSKVWDELHGALNSGVVYKSPEWKALRSSIIEKLKVEFAEKYSVTQLGILMDEIDKELIRYFVVKDKKRIDGRDFETIRNLDAIVNYIPRVHGTGLFTRGLTQSLTFCTLASGQYKQIGQGMEGDTEKRYIHNYNFPPYSTGETGNVGGANRRAIGHGVLAEKALLAVLPKEEDFPYTIRVVSEILSSNGSTSMAAACGSSLALMDAGVPISSHVGGIGIGLFVDKSIENPSLGDFIVLTDIIGEEDFAGYMDFKLTGTRAGMTAIQLELKLQGIPLDLLDVIFERSFIARQKVLDVMDSAISAPRTEVSQYAPKIKVVFIDPDKVGMVIGSGGSMIKDIVETTGAELDITEMEGKAMVSISAIDPKAIAAAEEWVLSIVQDIKVGDIFEGEVNRIEAYGAFVKLNHTKDGLLHVSELANTFVKDVNDYVKMGDRFKVKVIGVENGKVSVSKKALEQSQEFHR